MVQMRVKVFFRKAKNVFKRLPSMYLWYLSNIAKFSVICYVFPNMRANIWRKIGVNIGKNVSIGWDVFLDVNYADLLTVEDDVWFANRSTVFCHRRDMSKYYIGERYKNVPQGKHPVLIKKGACISIGAIIMPGVIIGEGAVVGAGAVVTKNVPAWSLVAGCPAKVIRLLDPFPEEKDLTV
jgi:acetyltransferase-like isoleucine patch superfamily enzyme